MIIPIGATVRITKVGHWAFGKRVVISSYPDIPELSLIGKLLAFECVNHFGEIDEHVISDCQCELVSLPSEAEAAAEQMSLFT